MPATRRLLALTLALACKPSPGDDTTASDAQAAETTAETGATDATPTTGATDATPTTGTTDAPVAPCPDHDTLDSCCCFAEDNLAFVDVVCPAPALCSTMLGSCNNQDYTDCAPDDATAEAALDCILDALQGSESGAVRWTLTYPDDPQENDQFAVVYTSGAGQVFWSAENYYGIASDFLGVQRHSLADLHLDTCAAEATAKARFECLRTAFTSPPEEICVEPNLITGP